MKYITFKSGYKVQLELKDSNPSVVHVAGIRYLKHILELPGDPILSDFHHPYFFTVGGGKELYIREGYAWDGASGPTIDTKDTYRASLVHDVLWQAISEGHLSESLRKASNREFLRILLEDARNWIARQRAKVWYQAVDKLGLHWVKHFGTKAKLKYSPKKPIPVST